MQRELQHVSDIDSCSFTRTPAGSQACTPSASRSALNWRLRLRILLESDGFRPEGPFSGKSRGFIHYGRKMPPANFRESTDLWSLDPYTFLPPQGHGDLLAHYVA
jgi:hypothetical protein